MIATMLRNEAMAIQSSWPNPGAEAGDVFILGLNRQFAGEM
jgi:hypothetical protein